MLNNVLKFLQVNNKYKKSPCVQDIQGSIEVTEITFLKQVRALSLTASTTKQKP